MTVDENTYEGGEVRMKRKRKRQSRTSAVPEVVVGGRVVLAEPLQDELVVQQAVQRPEEEDVEGQVANSLLLEVSTHGLHLTNGPEGQRCKVLPFKMLLHCCSPRHCFLIKLTTRPLLAVEASGHIPAGPLQFHQAL